MTWDELNRYSTRLNRLLGGGPEPVCVRVYVNARIGGGIWLLLEHIINFAFLPWERNHTACAYKRRLSMPINEHLELDDELWPLGEYVRRPPMTQCALCARVIEQDFAVRSTLEDFCSVECRELGCETE